MSDALKLALPLIAAAVAWFFNERAKRVNEEYIRKEKSYAVLLQSLSGFMVGVNDTRAKQGFLDEVNRCWLYCPDEVILALYAFLETTATGADLTDEARRFACGRFVEAVRRDLLSRKAVTRNNLSPADFRIWRAN